MNISAKRPFALLAAAAVLVAAFAFVMDAGPASRGVEAAGTPTASVSCADIYQDIQGDTPLGSPHDADDIPAASSMNRVEPSQSSPGDFDLTTVTYLGPDEAPEDEADVGVIPGDAIPDDVATAILCGAAGTAANAGVEANGMHPQHTHTNQYNDRPSSVARFGTYDATNNEDGGAGGDCGDAIDNGDSGIQPYSLSPNVSFDNMDTDCYDFPGASPDTLVSSGCAFAQNSTDWSRTDTFSRIVSKTAKGVNYGRNILMLATNNPTTTIDTNGDTVGDEATNPNECSGGLAFPSISESNIREPSTDEPALAKNTANSIATDPSGGGLLDTADGLADDWDGDGCTDWDELDKGFSGTYPVSVTGPVHGTDPFNPADCDQNLNSNIAIAVTAGYNTAGTFAVSGNGNYFRCLGDMSDPKGGGTRAIGLRMSCYSDSPASVVNPNYPEAAGNATCPPAPANMCGDGQSAGVPPGSTQPAGGQDRASRPYQDIDAVNYPILAPGTYNKGANTLDIGGCFASYAAAPIGPHIYGTGTFDSRVGAGVFQVQFGITDLTDCQNGPPFSSGANACVLMPDIAGGAGGDCIATIVEMAPKKNILTGGSAIPIQLQRNTDRDNCSDSQELRSNQMDGGKRDPFSDWDYFNPTGDKLNRVDDILAVVGQYFMDDPPGNIDYTSLTDRTAIPGANEWNLGPPNGLQRVDDILAIVKQYFHDCND